jgi:class 3 adenylate cyclase
MIPGGCSAPHVVTPSRRAVSAAVSSTSPSKHLADRVLSTRSALEGERKRVPVLFCDVVESYRLAERLGPEGMRT